jgi:hypothetical protein
MSGLSFDEAVNALQLRQSEDSLIKRHMIAIRDRYNGDFVMPMTEVPDEPSIQPPIPALIAETIDNTAMRAASTRPAVFVPSMDPGKTQADKRAENRRRAYNATWYNSKLQLKLRRAARHLVGYGVNCMGVVPYFNESNDYSKDGPRIEVRDPLTAYPDDTSPEEVRCPTNIGFVYPRSPDWIVQTYPESRQYLHDYHSDLWDIFEWIDEATIYIGILGPRMSWGQVPDPIRGYGSSRGPLKLRQWANRAAMVPFVCPGRVTLDRIAGQVTKMVPIIDMYAQLMALEAIAAEKGVFADKYLMSRANEEIALIGADSWADGRTGRVNLIAGAEKIGELGHTLNPGTFQVADRLERSVRMSAGQPGIFGGEMTGAVRSGQTINQLGQYAVDPRVQEVQEMIEYQLSAINEGIHAVYKGYWPNKKFTIFSGWPSDRGYVEFQPSKDMEDCANVVAYGATGLDVSQLTVALGQAMQMKLMGRRTAQRKHPMVDNPDEEEKAVILEALQDATLASFLARAQQGSVSEVDILAVADIYNKSGNFITAVKQAHEQAQKRQATEAPPPDPGQAAAPETQPGLSPAGTAGVEQPPPQAGPGGGNPAGVAALLQALGGQAGAGAPVAPTPRTGAVGGPPGGGGGRP